MTKSLAEELKKLTPAPMLPLEVFNALRGLVPMVAVEVLILEKDDSFPLIEKMGQFRGWALPGGYLGLNETFEEACQRVAKKYLAIEIENLRFVNVYNLSEELHGPGQGHAVALLFKATSPEHSSRASYFKKIPDNILPHHLVMMKENVDK